MIALEPFKEQDFERLISWIDCEEDLLQFAGAVFLYPLTTLQLAEYITSPDRIPFRIILTETNEVIGHCELNYMNEIPRLSRILIGKKEYRNKGYGKLIVQKMVEKIFNTHSCLSVELIVFDWNLNAINCYSRIGFIIREGWESISVCNDTRWRAISMILERDIWEYRS